MASGYADGDSLDDRLDPEGYVRTGDFARIDGDGFVWIEGRVGDVINRGGNKVFPGQVEEVLLLSPGVREVAVVGLPDERLGEVPVAFVVGDASDSGTRIDCAGTTWWRTRFPSAFRRMDEFPRSEVGKVLRRELVLMGAAERVRGRLRHPRPEGSRPSAPPRALSLQSFQSSVRSARDG